MAVRQLENAVRNARPSSRPSSVESAEDSNSTSGDSPSNLNQLAHSNGNLHMEPEYHTEESSTSSTSGDDSEQNSDMGEENPQLEDIATLDPPLLPAELLKEPSSPDYASGNAIAIPWNQMTRAQKRRERQRSRIVKERLWARTQPDSVLLAKRKAKLRQAKARIEREEKGKAGKAVNGRVEVSGRQKLLEARRRAVERTAGGLMKGSKKGRKRRTKR